MTGGARARRSYLDDEPPAPAKPPPPVRHPLRSFLTWTARLGVLGAWAVLYGRGMPAPVVAASDRYPNLRVPELWVGGADRRAHGRTLFHANCQPCHGAVADGNGLLADGVTIRPANLRGSMLLRRSTPKTLFATIRDGVPGTPMHGWPGLSDDDTWDLVAWVLNGTP